MNSRRRIGSSGAGPAAAPNLAPSERQPSINQSDVRVGWRVQRSLQHILRTSQPPLMKVQVAQNGSRPSSDLPAGWVAKALDYFAARNRMKVECIHEMVG